MHNVKRPELALKIEHLHSCFK